MARKQYPEALEAFDRYVALYPDGKFNKEARKRRIELNYNASKHARALELLVEWRRRYGDETGYDFAFKEARCLQEAGRHGDAVPFYRKVMDNPETGEDMRRLAHVYSIQCLFASRQFEAVPEMAESFIATYPKAQEKGHVCIWLGKANMELKRLPEAEKAFQGAVDFFHGDVENFVFASTCLAELLQRQERWHEMSAVWRNLVKLPDVKDAARYCMLAAAGECQAGHVDEAKADYETVLGRFRNDTAAVKEATIQLMELFASESNFAKACDYAVELEKLCTGEELAKVRLKKSVYLFQLNQLDEAIDCLRQTLTVSGLSDDLKLQLEGMLGRMLLKKGANKEAVAIFDHILQSPPEKILGLVSGNVLLQLGETLNAISEPQRAEKLWRLLREKGETPQARFRATIRLAQALGARGAYGEAEALLMELTAEKQQEELRKVIGAAEIFSQLAEVQMQIGKTDLALRNAEKALKESDGGGRDTARALWVLANILHKDNPKEALSYATRCFVLMEDDVYSPKTLLLSVRIFMAMGRPNDARMSWQELEKRYPAWAAEASGDQDIQELLTGENAP